MKDISDMSAPLSRLVSLLAVVCGCACQPTRAVAQLPPSKVALVRTPASTASAGPAPAAGPTLQSVVYERIREDNKILQQGFAVSVKNGVIELTGRVDNLLSRDRATRVAEVVRGVRAVDNRMEIVPEKRNDADVESD
jgi:hypothetical protein